MYESTIIDEHDEPIMALKQSSIIQESRLIHDKGYIKKGPRLQFRPSCEHMADKDAEIIYSLEPIEDSEPGNLSLFLPKRE